MHKKEQYIINNKHVEYERSLTKYDKYKYRDLICIDLSTELSIPNKGLI